VSHASHTQPVDRNTGVICDQTVFFTCFYAAKDYGTPLRRIRIKDMETHRQEAARSLCQPLRNPADFEPDPVRENADGSITYANHH
jgi:hypothetical protein